MRIALDAMGGDFQPHPNIAGAIAALEANPQLEIWLVGDMPTLEPLLAKTGFSSPRLHLHPSDGWVEMEEKPVDAIRKKPNCSIVVCWQLMASRVVDAVVSAGHTGAVVAAGLRTRLFLKGVKRPGIAVALPTLKGRTVLMDIGANPAARPEHLLQYGIIGSIYAREILGIASPTVGLMNIGSEDGKGTDLVVDSHALFTNSHLKANYLGNVEGRGLYAGEADVIICEGFVGNVVLKVSEGLSDMLIKTVSQTLMGALTVEREQAVHAFRALNSRFQYHEFGGAPLLGVDGACIICHGSSNERSIFQALKVATSMKTTGLNEKIVAALALEDSAPAA